MITDSKNKVWTADAARVRWTTVEGDALTTNPDCTDEQVLSVIEGLYLSQSSTPKTDAERIAELEAQVSALMAKLS
jgi:hypothetical protein